MMMLTVMMMITVDTIDAHMLYRLILSVSRVDYTCGRVEVRRGYVRSTTPHVCPSRRPCLPLMLMEWEMPKTESCTDQRKTCTAVRYTRPSAGEKTPLKWLKCVQSGIILWKKNEPLRVKFMVYLHMCRLMDLSDSSWCNYLLFSVTSTSLFVIYSFCYICAFCLD